MTTPIWPTMWQAIPASGSRDLKDYLEIWLFEDLTDEELYRGYQYLDGLCIVDGCDRPILKVRMCGRHYQQQRIAKQRDQHHK